MPEIKDKVMYYLSPLIKIPETILLPSGPNSMYHLPPLVSVNVRATEHLHSVCNGVSCEDESSSAAEATKVLAARQEAVLQKLQLLQKQLSQLKTPSQGITNKDLTTATTNMCCSLTGLPQLDCAGVCHDLVIRASTLQPPYIIIALAAALRRAGYTVHTCTMQHSSLQQGVVPDDLEKQFSSSSLAGGSRADHQIVITVLWSDVLEPTLMVQPTQQCAISGVGNICRYLCRLLPASSPCHYEASPSLAAVARTDDLLDQCTRLLQAPSSNRLRAQFIKRTEAAIKKQGGGGNVFGECGDAVVWSTAVQVSAGAQLPATIADWVARLLRGYTTHAGSVQSRPIPRVSATGTIDAVAGPIGRDGLMTLLERLSIPYQLREHRAVMTVEDLMDNVAGMPGMHMKNLFLKDKKKNLYLLAARHDAKVQLSSVGSALGCKELRFADAALLHATLGVLPGHVTVYALINDTHKSVRLVLDDRLKQEQYANFHPMVNTATLGVKCSDLFKFLDNTGHDPVFVTFDSL